MKACWQALLGAAMVLLAAPGAHAVPEIQRWETENGARVLFVRTTALPIVDVRLTFDAGSARDGDQPGLARLTSNLMLEGSGELSAGEVARGFERLGARVSTQSERDMGIVSLRSLTRAEVLDEVIGHFADVIGDPVFPADAVERVKRQMRVGLRQDQQSPRALAAKAFARALYGDHPYGHPPEGTMESVKALDRAAVKGFHERYYTSENLTLAIVGDVGRKRAERMAERITGGLPRGEAAPALPPVPALDDARTVRVPYEGEQTHVLMGQPAVSRSHPDYFPLYVANHVLGGNGLVSILAEELRNKRGLSYSTYSYLAPMAQAGRFAVGTQVRSDALGEALTVLRDTIGRFHREGPSGEAVTASKRNITGSFPLDIDSNNDLVGYIGMIGFYGLPLDYLDRLPGRIEAVDRAAAGQAFRQNIDPDSLVTVLVGPAEAIGAE